MSPSRTNAITAQRRSIFRCFSKAFLTLNAIEVHSNKMINDIIPINFENYEMLPTIALIKGRVRRWRLIASYSFFNTRPGLFFNVQLVCAVRIV